MLPLKKVGLFFITLLSGSVTSQNIILAIIIDWLQTLVYNVILEKMFPVLSLSLEKPIITASGSFL